MEFPSRTKDHEKTTPPTVTAEAGHDDFNSYSLSSLGGCLQEALRFVLGCLRLERRATPPPHMAESGSCDSGEKESELVRDRNWSPSPQLGEEGEGEGNGRAPSASPDPRPSSAADDPPSIEAAGGDPMAGADDPPSTVAQVDPPARPPINTGSGGQHH